MEAILFDLDGTLWDSADGVLKTWNMVIAKHPECNRGLLTEEELAGYFGLPMKEIANRMFSHSTEEEKEVLMEECCKLENEYLAEHGGILFPKLAETLEILHKEYKLFIVSNCQSGYIESFIKAHKMEAYFDDIQCWGDNMVPKGENNKLIMQRNRCFLCIFDKKADSGKAWCTIWIILWINWQSVSTQEKSCVPMQQQKHVK